METGWHSSEAGMLFPSASWMRARALWVWEPTLSWGLVVGSSPWLLYAGLSLQFPLQNPLLHTLALCKVASEPLIPLKNWLPGIQHHILSTVEFSEAKPLLILETPHPVPQFFMLHLNQTLSGASWPQYEEVSEY